jgi:signal transduction histidine kinase
VFVDKPRMQQVFVNLLKNAIAAMPNGGSIQVGACARRAGDPAAPAVLRELLCCDEAREVVDFFVRDSGSGIAPEVLPRIFDPFFSTKEVGKGSGLGLFIVYELVADHEGCIAAESPPGGGAVFHVRLPQPVKEKEA